MTGPALHTPARVFSARHVPTWLLLAAAAGSVNCAGFFACQRFVTHVTGTVTRLGFDWGSPLAAEYGLVLGSFIVGAGASALLVDVRHARGQKPLHAIALLIVAGVLALVAALGVMDTFGPFGGAVETAGDFALLSLLAFAMGLQNASVFTSTGMAVRTTHLTGPATDLGVGLVLGLAAAGERRADLLRASGLRMGTIFSFALGAGLTGPLCARYGYVTFLVPAGMVFGAVLASFVPSLTARPATPVAATADAWVDSSQPAE